ncbi:hypothetical protein JOE11_003201 [Robbsia andropogonis]
MRTVAPRFTFGMGLVPMLTRCRCAGIGGNGEQKMLPVAFTPQAGMMQRWN